MALVAVAGDTMAEGFLGRWAQRKADARDGKPLTEPVQSPPPEHALVIAAPNAVVPEDVPRQPTLEDAQALGFDSDFKPFIARSVDPEVRNTAMKKLFADPHFNVMDRLDIYIDDYSKSDPLPLSMLRQMASAKFLNLFEDEESAPETQALPVPIHPSADMRDPDQATGPEMPARPQITSEDHANTDLRLQQDHAAGPQRAGPGIE
jgi:hypothetical protein